MIQGPAIIGPDCQIRHNAVTRIKKTSSTETRPVARTLSHCATQRFLHGWKYPHPRPAQGTVISINQFPADEE